MAEYLNFLPPPCHHNYNLIHRRPTVAVQWYNTLQWWSRSTVHYSGGLRVHYSLQWWLSSTAHYRGGLAVQYTIVYSGGSRSVMHYLVRIRRYSTLQVGPAIRHTTV